MKRIAALYDIHGNLPALEAVLEDVRRAGVDRIVVGGDVVPGPMPHETLACLTALDLPVQFIQGNGDRETLNCRRGHETGAIPEYFREAMRWNAAQLTDEDVSRIAGWPLTLRLGDTVFCHATPRNDSEIFTSRTAAAVLQPIFDALNAPVVVCGHTHMQFDRRVGKTRLVNAGSVGMPFQEPGAYWLLLGPEIELRRTAYDLAAAADRIRQTAYPQAADFAAKSILQPPSEEAMLEAFAKAELT